MTENYSGEQQPHPTERQSSQPAPESQPAALGQPAASAAPQPPAAPPMPPTPQMPTSAPAPGGSYGETYTYPPAAGNARFGPYADASSPAGYGPYSEEPSQLGFGPYPDEPAPATPSTPSGSRPNRTILIAAITAALVGGGIGAGTVAAFDGNTTKTVSALPQTTQTAPLAAKVDGTVTAAAEKIQPSVVTINVSGQQEQGTGSGVIIRSDGYILTNDHVVSVAAGGGTISVVTNDGQQARGTVVGRDSSDDLAVIKVSGLKNLTAATFAKSGSLVVGQTVVAVGAPLGLSDTVTSGIVSNTARPVRAGDSDRAVFNAVQTDAAINPGNSGGPLVDLNGNVVGINAAIATANSGGLQIPGQSTESGSIGIGFAIPSDEASRIAGELIATGKATHAVIGVQVSAQQQQGKGTASGATLTSVDPNSPASKAGLKAGDVVTVVDRQRITDADGLIAAIRSHAPGQTVPLTYVRGGHTTTVNITLGSASN